MKPSGDRVIGTSGNLLRQLREERIKPKLIAATLSHREYLKLRNTVRVVRLSGAPLDPEQEKKVKEFEAAVAAYEEAHP